MYRFDKSLCIIIRTGKDDKWRVLGTDLGGLRTFILMFIASFSHWNLYSEKVKELHLATK